MVKNYATLIFKILIISFPITIFLLGCQKKEEDPILPIDPPPVEQDSIAFLKSVKTKFGIFNFTYDAQNRVTTMVEVDATGKLIEVLREFQYTGDKLVKSIENLNSHGTYIYTYTGDLITKVVSDGGIERNFTYDINKNLTLFIEGKIGERRDSIVYEGYINNRPTSSIQYIINKDNVVYNKVSRRYTYDADNNLIKIEVIDESAFTTWRLEAEYFYDSKIPTILPKLPFPNEQGIEGGIFGNPNPDSKDVNIYTSNKETHYTSCFNKSQILTFTVNKVNIKGLVLEAEIQEDEFNGCTDGSLKESAKNTSYFEYMYIKK